MFAACNADVEEATPETVYYTVTYASEHGTAQESISVEEITILVAAAVSPISSLYPLIGAGIIAGIVQGLVCKPKVADMENMQEDASSLKGFYSNRILRVLLVFLLANLGSSIGAITAGASFIVKIKALFAKIMSLFGR